MIKLRFILILLGIFVYHAKAQQIFSDTKYPLVDFRSPLNIIPPALAGSFGELRSNHFHSGIDFRTNQREGYPVYAIADGYVSRLRVQNSGFGQAIYLNHPNGFTSVYGHLQRFSPKIAQEVKSLQYQKKSFEIDEFPNEVTIPVHKGDVIGYSGNRGSSGGPHLHFEIRNTKTEATINPQLFGITIPDNIPPVIYSMYVYRLNKKPFNEFTPKQYFPVTGATGNYRLSNAGAIPLGGEIGFGIVVTDRHNGASGLNGVYSIELTLDGNPIFTSSMEKFEFEDSRGVNSHIDYPLYLTTKRSVQKSFVDPGNPLNIYSNLVNNGRIIFNDGKLHHLEYTITDAKGNKSKLAFRVQAEGTSNISAPETPAGTTFYSYATTSEFNTPDIKVILPKGTLYNDLYFTYKTLPKPAGNAYSAVHRIHNNLTPLHSGFTLWIKTDSLALGKYKDKALIVSAGRSSQGGYFEGGYVKANPRTFGSYFVAIDTIPPTVVPLNVSEGKNIAGISKLSFKIRDNLSGIKSFNGYMDGKWVLMEFDTKSATLWHTFDERTSAGKHSLELIITDMKDNSKNYTVTFYK
jgi:murein DD-endopeptidase MepM/ murein hydrolase activator NlpD